MSDRARAIQLDDDDLDDLIAKIQCWDPEDRPAVYSLLTQEQERRRIEERYGEAVRAFFFRAGITMRDDQRKAANWVLESSEFAALRESIWVWHERREEERKRHVK
ncbi:hypothetical protein SEA_ENNEA_14 [Gordonia phage Ennea]|uniref:Uncharacterized protein n=1 Tax=Gordonia Phage Lollipop1437 TaxID=2588505 RepID=A0A4Y6EM61_9CAUD|nr:hypothetical protein KNU64_gp13 [Gordonia Phage Lollipop1437]QDF19117.1 hypothetical protein SEA_LOLLIPOP1437_13 [Gordonia Phage Lollipop1437]QRI45250.1 hypothetical protein SEA_ENNEA_14 [Gordonia phage Ennea]